MSTFDPRSFGRHLRAAREEVQLTQQQMSIRSRLDPDDPTTGISTAYWSALERAERDTRPSDFFLEAISRALRHSDLWVVREWAGMEREPDFSSTLRAINRDSALTDSDKQLFRALYMRFAGRRDHREDKDSFTAAAMSR